MAQDVEKPAASPNATAASQIIRNHAIVSVVSGVMPIPLVGVGLMGAVHLRMIRELARLYKVEFSEQRAKSIIGSVLGISAAGAAMTVFRLVPILNVIGGLTVPSAATYALGKVFVEHFESGGTFLTFDPARGKALYEKTLAEKSAAGESYAGIKP